MPKWIVWLWENVIFPRLQAFLLGGGLVALWLGTIVFLKGLPTWALVLAPIPLWLAFSGVIWLSMVTWNWAFHPSAHLRCEDRILRDVRFPFPFGVLESNRISAVLVRNEPRHFRERMTAKSLKAHVEFYSADGDPLIGISHAYWLKETAVDTIDLEVGEACWLFIVSTPESGQMVTTSGYSRMFAPVPSNMSFAVVQIYGENCQQKIRVNPLRRRPVEAVREGAAT